MPSPFPGMDPYLEHPQTWPNVHHRLISAIAIALGPQLRPNYRIVVEEAVYQTDGTDSVLIGIPDVSVPRREASIASTTATLSAPTTQPISVTLPVPETIRQGYLEVRDIATDSVVTVIEVLSPTNKRTGKGRNDYQIKREKIFSSATHLVEIDLLRQWAPMPVLPNEIHTSYRILVSASDQRPQADLYAFNLPDVIPTFGLPLLDKETGPQVDLKSLLDDIYEQSGYDLVIDYKKPPMPGLSDADAAWVEDWLRQQGLR